jgi:hypothetical protein
MRKSFKPAILAALVAAAVASPALATGDGGDNGMSPWYGDSWTNVQSKAPEATAVPSLQAQEEKAPAIEAWGHARDNMRARTQHLRESTSNAFHRMTGTTSTTADHSTGVTTSDHATGVTRADTPTTSANPPDPQAAPAAYSGKGVAPGPAAIDAGVRAQQNGEVTGTARDQAGPIGSGSNTGTVDPTGVGAATMGGSPYGGNQDPARLPSSGSSSTDVTPRGR